MHARPASLDDPLADFDPRRYTVDGVEKRVLVSGRGPAVVVLAAMPGISPRLARLARGVRLKFLQYLLMRHFEHGAEI